MSTYRRVKKKEERLISRYGCARARSPSLSHSLSLSLSFSLLAKVAGDSSYFYRTTARPISHYLDDIFALGESTRLPSPAAAKVPLI